MHKDFVDNDTFTFRTRRRKWLAGMAMLHDVRAAAWSSYG